MEIIIAENEKNKIEDWKKRLEFSDFKIFNTSWAKDKCGKPDQINVALFIELKNKNRRES